MLANLKTSCTPLLKKIGHFRRTRYLKQKRKRNQNLTPTIFTNNCIGGIIYSDLGLRFLSPTINIFIPDKDFFEFLNDVPYYSSHEPVQIFLPDISYPVGQIQKGEKSVTLYFVHYDTFEEAKEKWLERGKRINYDNIYVIMEHSSPLCSNNEFYQSFKSLPFANKRLLTYTTNLCDNEIVNCDFFLHNYYGGKIIKYPHLYSKQRYLDDFDYVSFLNNI